MPAGIWKPACAGKVQVQEDKVRGKVQERLGRVLKFLDRKGFVACPAQQLGQFLPHKYLVLHNGNSFHHSLPVPGSPGIFFQQPYSSRSGVIKVRR